MKFIKELLEKVLICKNVLFFGLQKRHSHTRCFAQLSTDWPSSETPGAASRDDGIFMGESLQQERESPWALTLTERVPEAFEIPPSDWPEKYFSGQSAKRNSRATLMSSYTRLFSSSNAVVAWPVQREHF